MPGASARGASAPGASVPGASALGGSRLARSRPPPAGAREPARPCGALRAAARYSHRAARAGRAAARHSRRAVELPRRRVPLVRRLVRPHAASGSGGAMPVNRNKPCWSERWNPRPGGPRRLGETDVPGIPDRTRWSLRRVSAPLIPPWRRGQKVAIPPSFAPLPARGGTRWEIKTAWG
ncbi:hypothetical protein GCM10010393_33720 [Streptomyces gobitricini]|uniref:Uncharacterized protein n=1 Tax=Streptomyces gobitricini TaxID=68211 RepID=A0ABP5ZJL4_9ACTN